MCFSFFEYYSHAQQLFYKIVSNFTNKLVKQLLSMTVCCLNFILIDQVLRLVLHCSQSMPCSKMVMCIVSLNLLFECFSEILTYGSFQVAIRKLFHLFTWTHTRFLTWTRLSVSNGLPFSLGSGASQILSSVPTKMNLPIAHTTSKLLEIYSKLTLTSYFLFQSCNVQY